MQNIILVEHPLLKHSLSILRDKNTDTETFRHHAAIVSQMIILEVCRDCKLIEKKIETPVRDTTGYEICRSMIFVPVLRAGISMLISVRDFLPWIPIGFIGLERDEKTAIAHQYYEKFPQDIEEKLIVVLDPMLATGGSASDSIRRLRKKGKNIALACIVAAPEGIKRIHSEYPDLKIYTGAIDDCLDERKFIVPGLGDFGDRYFGT